jgi:hypothetical protein
MDRTGEGFVCDLSDRGISTVLGYTLVIAIIFSSVVGIVAIGTGTVLETQRHSEIDRAAHSMTLFDSRAALVALGTSNAQSLSFGQDSGSFEVRPDAGWMSIKHFNYTEGETEELVNTSLGAFVYVNDGTEIGYQGGGVWRADRQGAARMLSPPEFHYREATLTLPMIRTGGSVSTGNSPSVTISSSGTTRTVFPNSTDGSANGTGSPYDFPGDGRPYENPLRNGTVEVHVHSEYYEGWANYFRERTSGDVTVFHNNETVHLNLISVGGSVGAFPMPPENEGVDASGMGSGHPVTEFRLNISEGQTGGGENHWAMYSTNGYNEFELHVEPEFGASCEARLSVYYHNTSTNEHEEWQTDSLDSSSPAVTCTASGITLDLTSDASDIEYTEIQGTTGSGTKFCFGSDIRSTTADNTTLTEHAVDPGSNVYFDSTDGDTDEKSLNFTVNHYLSRLGTDYSLIVKDAQGNFCPSGSGSSSGGSDSIDEGASDGVLRYQEATGSEYIAFLHVTENEIDVDVN